MSDLAIPQGLDLGSPQGIARLYQAIFPKLAPQSAAAADITRHLSDPDVFPEEAGPLAEVSRLSGIARKYPTPLDDRAREAGLAAGGAAYLDNRLGGIAAPVQGTYAQPGLPELELPDQPPAARPRVSPLATLLSIGASFASPGSAGQFNAAALDGALRGAEEENQRRQQIYKNDIAARSMLYNAAMTNAREKQRVDDANVDAASQSSVASYNRNIMLAKSASERFMAGNTAHDLTDFANAHDPEYRAGEQVKALLESIQEGRVNSAAKIKGISELLGVLKDADMPGQKMADTVFKAITAGDASRREQSARLKQATTVADINQRHADARNQVTEQHADLRNQRTVAGEMARTQAAQQYEDRRQQNTQAFDWKKLQFQQRGDFVKDATPREKVLQDNLKRQQDSLKLIEKDLTEARASYAASLSGTEPVKGLSKAQWRERVDSLQKEMSLRSSGMQQEESALEYEYESRKKAASSAPGRYNPATGQIE